MTEEGGCPGQCLDVIAGAKVAGEQDGRCALAAIEHQGRDRQSLATGSKHIGRADIARSDLAQVAGPAEFGQDQTKWDGTEQIADRNPDPVRSKKHVHVRQAIP